MIRRQRRTLSRFERHQAGRDAANHLRHVHAFKQAKRIGLYLDAFGEVPTRFIIELSFKLRKSVYLPVVWRDGYALRWARIDHRVWQAQRIPRHSYGMLQPVPQRGITAQQLDVVILPLVAFDSQGHRLGMGGGFYDRTFAHHSEPTSHSKKHRHFSRCRRTRLKPLRLGLAYDFQRVPALPAQKWDVSIHAVLTPNGLRFF